MRAISAAVLLLAILAVPAYAHHCRHHHHRCRDCDSRTPAANRITLEGQIAEIIYLPGSASVEVVLQTGEKVRLAPSRFLKENGIGLKEGQTLTVKGFWVDTTGGDLFIATSSGAVALRDSRGRPRW